MKVVALSVFLSALMSYSRVAAQDLVESIEIVREQLAYPKPIFLELPVEILESDPAFAEMSASVRLLAEKGIIKIRTEDDRLLLASSADSKIQVMSILNLANYTTSALKVHVGLQDISAVSVDIRESTVVVSGKRSVTNTPDFYDTLLASLPESKRRSISTSPCNWSIEGKVVREDCGIDSSSNERESKK